MKGWMVALIIMGVLVLAVAGWWVGTYNTMVQAQEEIASRFADVDVQLMRRADLIPNLVNTVKGYAAHEEMIFTEVAAARSRLLAATTPGEKMAANDQLTGVLGRLLAIAENYPALKTNENFLRLQDELAGTENRIGYARAKYNEAVRAFNTRIKVFPGSLIASRAGFEPKPYFEAEPTAKAAPRVEF